jgi:hypothetical protein
MPGYESVWTRFRKDGIRADACSDGAHDVWAEHLQHQHTSRVGQNHIFIGIYGVYTVFWTGKSHTVIYGVNIRFWPTLQISQEPDMNKHVGSWRWLRTGARSQMTQFVA